MNRLVADLARVCGSGYHFPKIAWIVVVIVAQVLVSSPNMTSKRENVVLPEAI